jgi:hypothetical protein
VALDARIRAAAEFKTDENKGNAKEGSKSEGQGALVK